MSTNILQGKIDHSQIEQFVASQTFNGVNIFCGIKRTNKNQGEKQLIYPRMSKNRHSYCILSFPAVCNHCFAFPITCIFHPFPCLSNATIQQFDIRNVVKY